MPEPNQPNTEPAVSPATPAPAVATPAPKPAEPAPAPPPAAPEAESPQLTMNTPFKIPGPDGREQIVTLGQLINKASEAEKNALSPEDRAEWDRWKKVQSGDPQAILEMFGKPAEPEDPTPTDSDSRLKSLQDKLTEAESRIQAMEGFHRSLGEVQQCASLRSLIQNHAPKLPHLAKAAEANQNVVRQINAQMRQSEEQLKQAGLDLNQVPQDERSKFVAKALVAWEEHFQELAKAFGAQLPQTPAPGQSPSMVDDQTRDQKAGAGLPPRFRVVNGQVVDQNGQPVSLTPAGQMTVPNFIPSPATSGTPAGNAVGTQADQPFGVDELRQRMRASAQTMGAQQQ